MKLSHSLGVALVSFVGFARAQQAPLASEDGKSRDEVVVDSSWFLPGSAGPEATGLDVAIVAAAGTAGTCQFTDPQASLLASGLFRTVDIINVAAVTPTLAQLQAYDACICWTNTTPLDFNTWGDVMADYVDAGGGVVVAVFANSTSTAGRHLGGRWEACGYEVIVSQSGNTSGASSLGVVAQPGHPVMAGVTTFSATSAFRPTGTALTAGSSLIASWSDGKVLVAEGRTPNRIDLGFYPPSLSCSAGWWTGDGALLLSQAMAYTAQNGGPSIFCTAKTGLTCGTPSISACGTSSASSASGFLIHAGPARSDKSGILLYNTALAGVPAPFQGGTLCVDAMGLRRAGSTNSGGTGGGGAGPCNATPVTCDGEFEIDMNAFAMGVWVVPDCAGNPSGIPPNNAAAFLGVAGTKVYTQFWGRDAVATGSFVSDGYCYDVLP